MSKRNEPGWHEPVQDVAGDEWEEELNALHETVVRVVDGTETPISAHIHPIADGREGMPLNADDEVRSNTLNQPSDDSKPAADQSEPPAIMRVFSKGAEFVKDNAAASAATAAAAGIGWLIWNSRNTPGPAPALDGVGQSIKDAAGDAADQAKSAGSSLVDKVKDAGGSVVDKVKDAGGSAVDKVKDVSGHAVDSVKEAGGHAVESAKSMTTGVLENVKSAGSSAAQSASTAVSGAAQKVTSTGKEQAKRVGTAALGVAKSNPIELALTILSAAWLIRSSRPEASVDSEPGKLGQLTDQAKAGGGETWKVIEGMVQKNPLVAGAIALTIGAIVGLLIPESNVENRVMGPKHDELRDKAMGAAQEFTEDLAGKVKAVATEAVNTVKEEAKNQGLVPGGDAGEQPAPAPDAGSIPTDNPAADESPANAI
ncbi:MAG: hypothetical protein ABIY70_05145 [Capsulimonas sp.]|uniref:hypothetical protein n=1 Tax=Capsulimonas sp. TaxID=2494211 RepID=UPI003265981C